MAIPRRVIALAASAAAAGVLLYLRKRAADQGRQQRRTDDDRKSVTEEINEQREQREQTSEQKQDTGVPRTEATRTGDTAAVKELSLFLAGDAWHDEVGWKALWDREHIESPSTWLHENGHAALRKERAKLQNHPALLAGCRRRWIVVCRYANIDVADAALLWNQTD
jgi:hypothetical protein